MPDLTRHNIILYAGDMDRLKQIHTGKLTPTAVIRELVRAHVERVEQRLRESQMVIPKDRFDLDEGSRQ